jgi:UDPglucose 6-dehydrogenase
MNNQIGIIGNGFVGGAVAYGFAHLNPLVYDISPEKSPNTLEEIMDCKYVFICLPTPMYDAGGGRANISTITNFISSVTFNKDQVLILKSTVPVGTTKILSEEYTLPNLVHCPEFLTAANANEDFVNADRTIVGGPEGQQCYTNMVADLFRKNFLDMPVYEMTSDESELVKYTANCFLATKVMFFNQIRLLVDENPNIDWDTLLLGVLADPRIGKSHTDVPGPDGEYGFGGTCFPKDINALIETMVENGIAPLLLNAVWEQNKIIRKNWDWADKSSAVSNE